MKRILLGLLAGITAGLLFAPKSGKKLREELKNSDSKFSDFGKELLALAQDASAEVKKVIESKEVQEYIKLGEKKLSEFSEFIDAKGKELSVRARKELDTVVGNALKNVRKTAHTVQKEVTKKATEVKKIAEKKFKDLKK